MTVLLLVFGVIVTTVALLCLLVCWMDWAEARCSPHTRPQPSPPRHWSGAYSKPRSQSAEGLFDIHTIKENTMADEPITQPQGDSLPPDTIQPMSELESEQALADDDNTGAKEA